MAARPKRVTIFKDDAGLWRFKVQSTNWRTIDSSSVGAEKYSTVQRIVDRRYPGVEVVVNR